MEIKGDIVKFFNMVVLACSVARSVFAAEVSITMDDPHVGKTPLLSPAERNAKILEALDGAGNLKAALFVCGKQIDNPEGSKLLSDWDGKGHLIANHSYSHLNFNSSKTSFEIFSKDYLKGEALVVNLKNFEKLFRFPFLKEGDTFSKVNSMRELLREKGYRNGHVSIDASDWYVDSRLAQRLESNPKADLSGYRDFYLKHIWKRAQFYNDLSKKLLGREVKHTLLIHHSLLNALFLKDLLAMFKSKHWNLVNAKDAFNDPVYARSAGTVPAGEGILWALAKEAGKFEDILRYPAEDGEYEKAEMNRLGL